MPNSKTNEALLKQGRLLQADVQTFIAGLNYSQAQILKGLFTKHRPKDVSRMLKKRALNMQTHDRPART